MGARKNPPKAKLIIALLLRDVGQFETLKVRLESEFGGTDVEGLPRPFTSTAFYANELGESHFRAFLAFRDLVPRESLGPIKLTTNRIEAEGLHGQGLRSFNLDPGLVTLGQLFLATTKDQRQRVYVGDGIYIEPTLYYQDRAWKTFPWTYPSYASGDYFEFLSQARAALADTIKNQGLKAEPIADF
jgi:Domain of unknown function (DUF4416)